MQTVWRSDRGHNGKIVQLQNVNRTDECLFFKRKLFSPYIIILLRTFDIISFRLQEIPANNVYLSSARARTALSGLPGQRFKRR